MTRPGCYRKPVSLIEVFCNNIPGLRAARSSGQIEVTAAHSTPSEASSFPAWLPFHLVLGEKTEFGPMFEFACLRSVKHNTSTQTYLSSLIKYVNWPFEGDSKLQPRENAETNSLQRSDSLISRMGPIYFSLKWLVVSKWVTWSKTFESAMMRCPRPPLPLVPTPVPRHAAQTLLTQNTFLQTRPTEWIFNKENSIPKDDILLGEEWEANLDHCICLISKNLASR